MSACILCAAEPADLVTLDPGEDQAALCAVCAAALTGTITAGPRWRCLGDAIWASEAPTQIAAYRLLKALAGETWAADLLEGVYLDPDVLARAEAGMGAPDVAIIHRDSNGAVLSPGDSVVLIKDLPVKGSSMIAKRGTAVRSIRLVRDNAEHIEGRVNDQTIVILTQFVKKS